MSLTDSPTDSLITHHSPLITYSLIQTSSKVVVMREMCEGEKAVMRWCEAQKYVREEEEQEEEEEEEEKGRPKGSPSPGGSDSSQAG